MTGGTVNRSGILADWVPGAVHIRMTLYAGDFFLLVQGSSKFIILIRIHIQTIHSPLFIGLNKIRVTVALQAVRIGIFALIGDLTLFMGLMAFNASRYFVRFFLPK